MPTTQFRAILNYRAALLLAFLGMCAPAFSQEVSSAIFPEGMPPAAFVQTTAKAPSATLPEAPSHRRFWDRENTILFSASAALSAADFVVTRDNLQNGGRELNPMTRPFSGSTAGLAVNFAGETAAVVGMSYFFHKTGHHKLERAVSMFNIGSSAAAVSYDLAHR
jgi:hypothetical protein